MSDVSQVTPDAKRATDGEETFGAELVLRKGHAGDAGRLSQLLSDAFYDDPVFSWCYPDPSRRRRILPGFFQAILDAYLPLDEIYTAGDHAGGAVWAPPEGEIDDARLGAAIEEVSGEDAPRGFQLTELMEAVHPSEPHQYLFFLGTRPELQSRGIGGALLELVLEGCDRSGTPAYLEATSEANRRLYSRHGFEVCGEIRVPEGPTLWPMWRRPQQRT